MSRGPYRRHSPQFKLQLCNDIRAGTIGRKEAQRKCWVFETLCRRRHQADQLLTDLLVQVCGTRCANRFHIARLRAARDETLCQFDPARAGHCQG